MWRTEASTRWRTRLHCLNSARSLEDAQECGRERRDHGLIYSVMLAKEAGTRSPHSFVCAGAGLGQWNRYLGSHMGMAVAASRTEAPQQNDG